MYYLLVYCQYICLRIELDFCDTPLYRTLYFLQFLLCYAQFFSIFKTEGFHFAYPSEIKTFSFSLNSTKVRVSLG